MNAPADRPGAEPRHAPSTGDSAGNRIGWMELFYDLIFVGSIVIAASDIDVGEDASELVILTLSAVAGFTTWLMTTLIFNRYPAPGLPTERRDLAFRAIRLLLIFIQMACLLVAALSVRQSDGGLANSDGVIAFAVAQLSIVGLLIAGAASEREKLSTVAWPAGLLAGAAMLLLISAPHANDWLGAIIHLVALAVQIIAVATLVTQPWRPIRFEHLSERFGLLTLLALGESFVALAVPMLAATEIHDPWLFVIALAYPMAIFGMYFGAAAPIREQAPKSMKWWIVLQGALVIETAAVGHRLSEIAADPERADDTWELLGLASGIAVQLIALAGLAMIGRRLSASVIAVYWASTAVIVVVALIAILEPHANEWAVISMALYMIAVAVAVNLLGLRLRSSDGDLTHSRYLES